MKNKILTLLAACVFASPASAQTDHSVFGIELGKPLSIPQCALQKAGDSYVYSHKDTAPCFTYVHAQRGDVISTFRHPITTTPVNEAVKLVFPKRADILTIEASLDGIDAVIMDGNVEAISFHTYGITNADTVLGTLRTKYGEPTTLGHETLQNGYGASYPVMEVHWKGPEIWVTFLSWTGDIHTGQVGIATTKAHVWAAAIVAAKKRATTGPKL